MNLRQLIPSFNKPAKESYTHQFTVFTPVYNSEKTIERVHKSLIDQTFKDFEWLIINDGSTDGSTEIIENLIATSELNIRFVNNSINKHKMACFMEAIKIANGKFLLTLDSDDECMPKALKTFLTAYEAIPEHMKHEVCSISALCVDQYGTIVGSKFPKDPYFSNTFESYYLDKVKGEKWGFTKTNVLKGIIYSDDFVNNGFMSEGIIWNLLAKLNFKTKYINKELRIYHRNLENSISSSDPEKVALGRCVNFIVNFNWFFGSYFIKIPTFFLKNLYFLLQYVSLTQLSRNDLLTAIDSRLIRSAITLLWPFRTYFIKK